MTATCVIVANPFEPVATVTVTATDGGSASVSSTSSVAVNMVPSVSSIATPGSSPTKGTGGLDYTVTFSQAVDNVVAGDFTVTKGAGVTGTPTISITAGSTGSTVYTVHVAGLAGNGTAELDLTTYTGIVSHANNSVHATTGFNGTANVYTLDNQIPVINSVTLAAGTYNPTTNNISVTIGIANDTNTFTGIAGTIDGYSLVYDSKTATTVTAHFLATSNGTEIASGGTVDVEGLVLTDIAGNANSAYSNATLSTTGVTLDTHAPTAITIGGAATGIYTGVASATVVGALADTDASTIGDTTVYTLAAGNGTNDADNAKFSITGGNLVVGGTALTAGTAYHVFLKAQDENGSGNSYTQAFTITGASGPTVVAGNPSVTWTETVGGGGTAQVLDSGLTVAVGADNSTIMTGATASITANYTAGDTLACTLAGNVTIASNTGGVLTLTGNDTAANYQAVLDSVTFTSSSNDPAVNAATRTISWQVHDQYANSSAQTTTVAVHAVDNPPTLTTTTGTVTVNTASTLSAALFSNTAASPVEASQSVSAIMLTVSNVVDGAAEKLSVDGTLVALNASTTVTSGANTYSVDVSPSGSVTTVTITKAGNFSASAANALINGLKYENTNANATAGNRVVTLTQIRDSGVATYGGNTTTSVSLASTAAVVANDIPVINLPAVQNAASLAQAPLAGISVTDTAGGTYAASVSVPTGMLNLALNGTTVTAGANDSSSVTVSGSRSQVNAALGSLKYTPTAFGSNIITVSVNDGGSAFIGGAKTGSNTITFTATAPEKPPPPPLPPPPAPVVVDAPKPPPPPVDAPVLVTSIRAAVADTGAFTHGSLVVARGAVRSG